MDYNFKKFENTHGRFEDRITVTKTASFGFPTRFYTNNNIQQYTHIVVYYDETQKAIGIRFTLDESEKNKFAIIHHKQYGGSALARSFFKSHDIDLKNYYGRYTWEKYSHPDGELFVIKLISRTEQVQTEL